MNARFSNVSLKTTSGDGRNFQPLEYLYYRDSRGRWFRTKSRTDGGSTPFWLWWCIPPFGKKDWFSFIIHDGCFRDSIDMEIGGFWVKWTPDEAESNWLIHDAMKAQGYSPLKRFGVYLALEWFGWKAFDEDRKAKSRRAKAAPHYGHKVSCTGVVEASNADDLVAAAEGEKVQPGRGLAGSANLVTGSPTAATLAKQHYAGCPARDGKPVCNCRLR